MRKWRRCLLVGLVIITVQASLAQTPTQNPKPGKTYVLKAARMFDGKSNSLSTPGLVVVTGGKIAGVGAQAARRRKGVGRQRKRARHPHGRFHYRA